MIERNDNEGKNDRSDREMQALHKRIISGDSIKESELLRYIQAVAFSNRSELEKQPADEKPFSVVWYNRQKRKSFILKTRARDSIQAIENLTESIPDCANFSAYPVHLPDSLQFIPDDMM